MVAPVRGAQIRSRLACVHARGRTAEALYTIVLDALDPDARHDLDSADWASLCELLCEPVNEAAEVALETLAGGLEATLVADRPDLVTRLEQLRLRAELGYD